MSESKSGKMLLIAILILFGGGGFLIYPQVQWFRFEMAARDAVSDKALGRFPDSEKILGVTQQVQKSAAALKVKDLKVTVKLTERRVGPTTMWFVAANVKSGTKEFETERRIETEWERDDLEYLREEGIVITRVGAR